MKQLGAVRAARQLKVDVLMHLGVGGSGCVGARNDRVDESDQWLDLFGFDHLPLVRFSGLQNRQQTGSGNGFEDGSSRLLHVKRPFYRSWYHRKSVDLQTILDWVSRYGA